MDKNTNELESLYCHQIVLPGTADSAESEISLVDLWMILMQSKRMVIGVFLGCVVMAIGLVCLLPKVYRAEVDLFPPGVNDIANLNFINKHFEPQEIYVEFTKNLQRKGVRYKFYIDNDLGRFFSEKTSDKNELYSVFEREFDKRITVRKKNAKNPSGGINVLLEGTRSELLADWLEQLVNFIDRYTVNGLVKGIEAEVNTQIELLEMKIATLRRVAKQQRQDRIKQLQEALIIAKRIAIKDNENNSLPVERKSITQQASDNFLLATQAGIPLFYRGEVALQSEINSLIERKDESPFIPGLRKLEAELAELKNKKIDASLSHAVLVDQPARVLDKPVSPKSMLIIALSAMVGLMVGVFSAFIKNMVFGAYDDCEKGHVLPQQDAIVQGKE